MAFDGTWRNEPPYSGFDGDALVMRTGRDTDWWNNTYYGFLHGNGHFLGQPAEGDRTLELTFSAAYRRQYDQAGAMVHVDDRTWMKCGIEFTEGVMKFSVVVTRDDQSDWSVRPWHGDPSEPVELRRPARSLDEQPGPQHIGEEVVVAEPSASIIERNQEEVRPIEAFDHRRAVGAARERVARGRGEPLEHRRVEQELADLGPESVARVAQSELHQCAPIGPNSASAARWAPTRWSSSTRGHAFARRYS